MSRTLLPLAGFEVTLNGRFWVTAEVLRQLQLSLVSQQHFFILQHEWHRNMNVKPIGADQGNEFRRGSPLGAQCRNENIGINNNL